MKRERGMEGEMSMPLIDSIYFCIHKYMCMLPYESAYMCICTDQTDQNKHSNANHTPNSKASKPSPNVPVYRE